MEALIMAASAVAGTAALGLGSLLTHRLLRYRHADPAAGSAANSAANSANDTGNEGAPTIAMERYAPMARLLDDKDLQFLTSRPGYRPEVVARLRRSRRRIFRIYLAELSSDFHVLHAAARRLVSDAPAQHADMVGVLMQQQFTFWRILAGIEVRLALHWAGLGPADARGLLEIIEQLQRSLTVTLPVAQGMPA
jgi:hypothetical protein